MSEFREWFQASLPAHLTWGGDPAFWRSAIIAESRKSNPAAFIGRNLMRSFGVLHTQRGVILDLIMMLVDVQNERAVIAAFPSFVGPTVGAGIPMPSDEQLAVLRNGGRVETADMRTVGGDPQARGLAAASESHTLAECGLRGLSIKGPVGDTWKVVVHEFDGRPEDLLNADGHTLTPLGVMKIENLARGAVTAAASWVPTIGPAQTSALQVRVDGTSPTTGPSLSQSLAPATAPTSARYIGEHRTRAVVEVHGSSQNGFANNPMVKVFWNGSIVGELKSLGGHLEFNIESAGELRLKSGFRSTTVQINSDGSAIYLRWDRTWGRLIASSDPYTRL
jgi:hypothetical protein